MKYLLIILLFYSNATFVDNTATLQRLFDTLDVIELPGRKLTITKALILPDGKRLTGSPATVLFMASGVKQNTILSIGSNTVVENITLRSENDQRYWYIPTLSTLTSNVTGIVIRAGSKNVTVRNCRIANTEYGITCSHNPKNIIDNVTIDNVSVDSSFMSMLLTGVDRAFVTNYRSDKRHIAERDQRIGHHSYFEGVKRLFIDNYHAIGGCCDGLKLRNTVLKNISNQISNITIDSTGPLKIDYAGDVNISNITFNGGLESLWPAGFKTLQINNMIVNAIESPTAFTRIVTAGANNLPQGDVMRISGLITTGTVSMELTKIKRVFLSDVVMINPLGNGLKAVPISIPTIRPDTTNRTTEVIIDNIYVRQDLKHRQSQFMDFRQDGKTEIVFKNSRLDFGKNPVEIFMKADNSSTLVFKGVEESGIRTMTVSQQGLKPVFIDDK